MINTNATDNKSQAIITREDNFFRSKKSRRPKDLRKFYKMYNTLTERHGKNFSAVYGYFIAMTTLSISKNIKEAGTNKHTFFCANKEIATKCRISVKSVLRAKRKMEDLGVLITIRRGHGKVNQYILTGPVTFEGGFAKLFHNFQEFGYRELGLSEALYYAEVDTACGRDGNSTHLRAEMAKNVNRSKQTISRLNNRLREFGLLSTRRTGKKKPLSYSINRTFSLASRLYGSMKSQMFLLLEPASYANLVKLAKLSEFIENLKVIIDLEYRSRKALLRI